MKEVYENEKQVGMYVVVVDMVQPLTFDDAMLHELQNFVLHYSNNFYNNFAFRTQHFAF